MRQPQLRNKLGMHDTDWAPVTLAKDVEYPEMLDGVVDRLKRIADVVHEARFPLKRSREKAVSQAPHDPDGE